MHHLLQAIYELAMVLATRSLCNLASLNVFGNDIPQVAMVEVTHLRHDILIHLGAQTASG